MLELFSLLVFCLANELLEYIKKLAFRPHRFSIASFYYTISDTKIKLVASLSCRIRAAKIAMQILKILFGLRHRFIRRFFLLLTFHVVSTDFSGNSHLYINPINYFWQLKNILISQMTLWTMPNLNRY